MSGQQITEEEEEELQTDAVADRWPSSSWRWRRCSRACCLPLLVLLSVPMALVGVGGIFWATGAEFDSSAKIGLILMFGVVVNNAILLINRFRLQVREIVVGRAAGDGARPGAGRSGAWAASTCGGCRRTERQDILRHGHRPAACASSCARSC